MSEPRTILITGAAGMIGSEVAARLAAEGHVVIALVHSRPEIRRNNGRVVPTERWRGKPAAGAVTILQGDITRPDLGLDPEDYTWLRSRLDRVVHSAAITDFGRSAAVYETANVVGTGNVLKLVCDGRPDPIPLVHLSTAYVCGERMGRVLEEDLDKGQSFGTRYEESKFRAESAVRSAMASGLPSVIVRPSIVVGNARAGVVRDFKNIYVVLKLLTEGRVRSIPGHYDANLDLVPVDHVADLLTQAVVRFEDAVGRTFHAIASKPHTLWDFSEVMAEYPSFRVPRYLPPSGFSVERLPPGERVYYDRVLRHYESFFRRRMVFSDDAAYAFTGQRPAVQGMPQLRRLLNYALRKGYLGAALPDVEEVLAHLDAVRSEPAAG